MVEEAGKVIDTTRAMLEGGSGPVKLYPHNVLEGFAAGCLLDLRVRLAVDFLKGPLANMAPDGAEARDLAEYALDLATELLSLAESRGLVSALPDDDGLNRQLRLQAARTAKFSALQQIEGQKAAQEEAGRVSRVAPLGGRTFNG
jgi:hypothetical protein